MRIEIIEGEAVRAMADELAALCADVFDTFDPAYLTARLVHAADPGLVVARGEDGALIGFKLGYRRGTTFYSWLGGVRPSHRRRGLAAELMARQHAWAAGAGYRHVETRSRAPNAAMIILNLRSGFQITGFEQDSEGRGEVIQRKALNW
jgi:predicted GNAT superfamily acetyltransferase